MSLPTAPIRAVGRRARVVDAAIGGALLVASAVTIPLSSVALRARELPLPVLIVWALAITVPLAARRIIPGAVAVVVVAVFIWGQAIGVPEVLVSQIGPFLALYTLGAWSSHRRRAFVIRVVLTATIVVWFVVAVVAVRAEPLTSSAAVAGVALSALSTVLYLAAALAFGEAGWRAAVQRAALARRTEELQRERERTAAQAVALERTRIARELHDVVAHHVSVIGVQAGAARRVLTTRPDAAAEALGTIEESSRRAVDDLRRTVLALREDDASDPASAPSTLGVAQIAGLVDEARDAGLVADFVLSGDAAAVPPAAALTLYRVAQEALTNVRKHAGSDARVTVRVRVDAGKADLSVVDGGGAGRRLLDGVPGVQLGELGMRERVDAVGGRLETGPAGSGYRVHAVIPVAS